MTKRCCMIALLLLVVSAAGVSADAVDDEFSSANRFYEKKDYASAIRLYRSILVQGGESAALYFNLGNAYFKSGDIGRAVLYYMKARRLDPTDRDIIDNLAFARRFSRVQMEGVQLNPINSFFVSLVDEYRLADLAWLSSAVFVLLMLLLIARFGFAVAGPMIRMSLVVAVVLLVAAATLTAFKYRHDYLTRRAVVIAEESPVYTGPSPRSDVELQGAPGLVVEIIEDSGDYYNVLFENKRRGWIEKEFVAEI
ncbi:MAG: tetratricopeptide repeat protein [Candidatus Zixiibacteriota bacterium]|nr:MAG: tetratricopeptide repeat protein [candidate division Zixibacteria bacterium]